jgi:O-antigen/teichoic acid export membrane protein
LPMFSEIQGQSSRINRLFLRMTTLLATVALPLVAFAFCYGHNLLTAVYGRVYGAASAAFAIAAGMSMINIINGQITTVFYSSGRPRLHRRCVAITAVAMVVLVYPFVKMFGLSGGPLAALVAITTGYLFQIDRLASVTDVRVRSYLRSFGPGLIGSVIVLFLFVCTRRIAFLSQPIPNVMSGLIACAVAYSIIAAAHVLRSGQGVVRLETPVLKA